MSDLIERLKAWEQQMPGMKIYPEARAEIERLQSKLDEKERLLSAAIEGGLKLESKLDRYRSALERIIEAWDGDSESMHNDPAVIAREALSDE